LITPTQNICVAYIDRYSTLGVRVRGVGNSTNRQIKKKYCFLSWLFNIFGDSNINLFGENVLNLVMKK
jgi:hypothetical protein